MRKSKTRSSRNPISHQRLMEKLIFDLSTEIRALSDRMKIRDRDPEEVQERTMNGSPTFYALLQEMAHTHDRKSHDYASNNNPFGNYEFAGLVSSLFSHSPSDAGFVGRLSEKIYRLSVLEGGGKQPLNESIDDTERDIAVIATLWMASRRDRRSREYNGTQPK